MKKATLTIAIISMLLLAGLSTVTGMKTTSTKNEKTIARITEETVELSKLVDTKYQRHWFFFANVNSAGYAKEAVVRCYDGIISVTYSNGVTTINAPFADKTFNGLHTVDIYGFGGTISWSGSVTNKDISFEGFGMVCFVQPT